MIKLIKYTTTFICFYNNRYGKLQLDIPILKLPEPLLIYFCQGYLKDNRMLLEDNRKLSYEMSRDSEHEHNLK